MSTYQTLTNEVSLTFFYEAILDAYDIFEITDMTNTTDEVSDYKAFYRNIKRTLSPCARCVIGSSPNRYIIALTKDKKMQTDNFNLRRLHVTDLKRIQKRKLLTLLLSIMIKEGAYFEPTNIPYDIYYIHSVEKIK